MEEYPMKEEMLSQQMAQAEKVLAYLQDGRNKKYHQPLQQVDWDSLTGRDVSLFQIDEITYEEKAPRREALENIFGTFRNLQGINLLYMILGDTTGVKFYLGVVRDLSEPKISFDLEGKDSGNYSIRDIGKYILKPAIKGNFRGCKVKELEGPADKGPVLQKIQHVETCGLLEGVPTIDEKKENFQGVDRLVDVMLGSGDEFGLVVIVKPYHDAAILEAEQNLQHIYDALSPLARIDIQSSMSEGKNENTTHHLTMNKNAGHSVSRNENHSYSKSENHSNDNRHAENNNVQVSDGHTTSDVSSSSDTYSASHTDSHGEQTRNSKTYNGNDQTSHSDNVSHQYTNIYGSSILESTANTYSHGENQSHSDSTGKSYQLGYTRATAEGTAKSKSTNQSTTYQLSIQKKKAAIDWMKYIDDVLYPHIDDGRGKGLYLACAYLFGNMPTTLHRLANTVISLYSGPKGNRSPLCFTQLDEEDEVCQTYLKNLQIPYQKKEGQLPYYADALAKNTYGKRAYCGNWMAADQLSILAGMPQKEVIGLKLREEVEFGLNVEQRQEAEDDWIPLGNLVQSGVELEHMPVNLSRSSLDKHTFITGVTGSGKTTTCQNLLMESHLPFLVVEPAKTEYRILKTQCPDMIFFTPGAQDVAPFFLNPFELFPGEAITSRVDMLKATFEATFHMEAAIPQLLEAGLYRIYEDKGWNIRTNKWKGKGVNDADGPFADGVYAFPTLQDYYDIVPTIIREQGFDERLYDEYLGTIRSYLQGLLVGNKGMMLNTKRSMNFADLVTKCVVLELEEIRSGTEKSLIMGFIMTNLLQAVKVKHFEANQKGESFQHITLIEEAHRLLSKVEPGDSPSKRQGVTVFTDMLAEVRKYGESMIIVDQIPNKMTPEVLKNTNTKIVHKIFAQDDKDAIGNTIALNRDQKAFLSNLVTGRAVVFSQNWTKAVQVQMTKTLDTSHTKEIQPEEIHQIALSYLTKQVKRGILPGLELLSEAQKTDVESYLQLLAEDTIFTAYKKMRDVGFTEENMASFIQAIREEMPVYGDKLLTVYLTIYLNPKQEYDAEVHQDVQNLLSDVKIKADDEFNNTYFGRKTFAVR